VIFAYYSPIIDQTIASMPYNKTSNIFYGETSYIVSAIYFLVPWLTAMLITVPILILFFSKKKPSLVKYQRAAIITLLALLIGPGLIVNTVFKNHWGRPRPYQVLRGGETFSPVYKWHQNKPEDNSFCSGHAAIGFFLGVPLLALRRRKMSVIVSVIGGGIIGFIRILQGGHYLSDVLFAGVFVWLSAYLAIYLVDKFLKFEFKNE
jgi:lipid A 4'-phosphatase